MTEERESSRNGGFLREKKLKVIGFLLGEQSLAATGPDRPLFKSM